MDFLQRLAAAVLAQVQMKIFDQEVLERYAELFDADLFEIQNIREEYENLPREVSPEAERYRELWQLCGGSENGRWLLDLCLTALLYPEFQEFARENWKGVTLDAAAGLSSEAASYKDLKRTCACVQRILKYQKGPGLFLHWHFWADARILDYFLDEYDIDDRLKQIDSELFTGEESLEEIFVNKDVQTKLVGILRREEIFCAQVSGNKGCGKRFLLKKACKETGCRMLFVDLKRITEKKEEEALPYVGLILREGLLLKCPICYHGVDSELLDQVIDYFVKPLMKQGLRCFLLTSPEAEVIAQMDCHVEKVSIRPYGRNERIALWEGFSGKLGIRDQVDCVTAGSKFKLSAREIKKAVERIGRGFAPDGAGLNADGARVTESEISRVCEEVLLNPTCGNIKRIHVQYTLEDLKLLPEQKSVLSSICAHVWHRHKVYDEWNMDSRYAYGKNVSALFCGPPGTGKTMAVHVLANMLNLPLYRVDLSQVVDKYIGETEKRLEEIFDAAEKNNTVLFFDEADSIFGKRSEVADAKDRYANTEVSYILQRIEQYEGIVILATNYRKNIDEAFMRRIRYVVEFSLPGQQLRRELWMSSFSQEIPKGDINFEYLAEQFELSGGAIKNIVLNAAFQAASENRPVEMIHILRSVRNENVKIGKVMLPKDFGLYGALMEAADTYL